MNEEFFARLTSVIFLTSFIGGVLFNDKFSVHWQDFHELNKLARGRES